mgnify:CR=1 FL=1
MKKVSIIVPVYNVEEYLDKCLNSLVNQTLKDIEIIVVNDGTRDNSQDIIDKYKEKFPKLIKAYKKENGGLSSARNYGLDKASGEYISFIDSDDYIDVNMMKEMYNKAHDNNFDVVVCDMEYIYKNYTKVVSSLIDIDLKDKEEIKKHMINIYPAACNKIYKKNIIKDLKFKEGVWYEDVEFTYRLLPLINSIGTIKKPFYKYLQRENAITSTFNDKIFNYISNWNGVVEYYKDNNFYEEYSNELEYCYVRYLYATMVKGMTNFRDYDKYQKGVKEAIKNVKEHFPKYRKNKYFYKSKKGLYLLIFNRFIANVIYKKGL